MIGDHVAIGRLGAPKGVRGDLKVSSYSGESAHFYRLETVELRPRPGTDRGGSPPRRLRVIRVEGEGPSLTLAFEGYATPEAARALTGLELVVPREAASPLGPDEWYIDDLVGLSLVAEGKKLAVVVSVIEGGAEPWLEVRRVAGEGLSLVPFRKVFVGEVDLAAGTIELLAPWLLEEG